MTSSRINTILKNRKNKNKKGFSLVELIVVLVIMAILAAALVPTLIGYINQTRQSNAKNEAAAVVSAAQTIASSAYADGSGKYYDQSDSGHAINVVDESGAKTVTGDATEEALAAIEALSEVEKAGGTIEKVTFTNGVVTLVQYENGTKVEYKTNPAGKGTYTIVDDFTAAGKPATPVEGEESKVEGEESK